MSMSIASQREQTGVAHRDRVDQTPMSVTRVLQLLRLLADQPGGLALAPLCVSMNAPKTSVLSLLRGLTAHGYLQRSGAVYRLGPASFSLGAALVSASSLDIVAMPFLREAAARQYPLPGIGSANELAELMVWLLSDPAARVAGPVWAMDGGF